MLLDDLFESTEKTISAIMFEEIEEVMMCEAKMAWSRRGNKVVRKYRCTSGVRKGRIVSNAAQCGKPIDMKKRMSLKRTKAKFGSRMARKSKKTKRVNPASKRLKTMNRR